MKRGSFLERARWRVHVARNDGAGWLFVCFVLGSWLFRTELPAVATNLAIVQKLACFCVAANLALVFQLQAAPALIAALITAAVWAAGRQLQRHPEVAVSWFWLTHSIVFSSIEHAWRYLPWQAPTLILGSLMSMAGCSIWTIRAAVILASAFSAALFLRSAGLLRSRPNGTPPAPPSRIVGQPVMPRRALASVSEWAPLESADDVFEIVDTIRRRREHRHSAGDASVDAFIVVAGPTWAQALRDRLDPQDRRFVFLVSTPAQASATRASLLDDLADGLLMA